MFGDAGAPAALCRPGSLDMLGFACVGLTIACDGPARGGVEKPAPVCAGLVVGGNTALGSCCANGGLGAGPTGAKDRAERTPFATEGPLGAVASAGGGWLTGPSLRSSNLSRVSPSESLSTSISMSMLSAWLAESAAGSTAWAAGGAAGWEVVGGAEVGAGAGACGNRAAFGGTAVGIVATDGIAAAAGAAASLGPSRGADTAAAVPVAPVLSAPVDSPRSSSDWGDAGMKSGS